MDCWYECCWSLRDSVQPFGSSFKHVCAGGSLCLAVWHDKHTFFVDGWGVSAPGAEGMVVRTLLAVLFVRGYNLLVACMRGAVSSLFACVCLGGM